MIISTPRLILRPWQEKDLFPFARLNADPRVMEYFPLPLTSQESDLMVQRIQSKIEERGWGLWAASLADTAEFIGFIGLNPVEPSAFPVPFAPAVEVGWRLAYDHWSKGYATEGAQGCLQYGFASLKLPEIVSFTAVQNRRSRSVMEKIGMHRDPKDDFNNPKLAADHPLRPHVLYRISHAEWESQQKVNG